MEEAEKAVIDRNYHLLINNIIFTEDFYYQLRWNEVLPESMINDIQACKTREEKAKQLVYTLKIRGCDAFRKIRHVLHLTGHNFLADLLYEDETEMKIIKATDLFSKFPSIFSTVSDDIKAKYIKYLETKVKEKALAKVWNTFPADRQDALENKKTAFLQERDLRVKLDNKRKQITTLKEELSDFSEKLTKKELEIQALEKEREETRKRYKTELGIQARFNAANNSSIIRLREKFVSFNGKIKVLNAQIGEFLTGNNAFDSEHQENEKLSRLEQNVKTLLHLVKEQQDAVESKASERETVLALLKRSSHKTEPLSDIVKKYLERDEKAKAIVNKEIEKLVDILRKPTKSQQKIKPSTGVDMKHLRNMVATVRVEVEHLKKKLAWKDDQITDLIKETIALRQHQQNQSNRNTVSETLKGAVVLSPISSPDSTYEMQVAYKKFDNYLDTNPVLPDRNKRRGSLADVDLEPDPDEIDLSFMDKPLPESPRVKFPEVDPQQKNDNSITPRRAISNRRFSLMSDKDLTTILESDDNVEFEKLMSHIVKKTQPTKLPLICKDAMAVDFSND